MQKLTNTCQVSDSRSAVSLITSSPSNHSDIKAFQIFYDYALNLLLVPTYYSHGKIFNGPKWRLSYQKLQQISGSFFILCYGIYMMKYYPWKTQKSTTLPGEKNKYDKKVSYEKNSYEQSFVCFNYICYLPPISVIWKENHPLNALRFFTLTCQLSGQNDRRAILNLEIFHRQIVPNLL